MKRLLSIGISFLALVQGLTFTSCSKAVEVVPGIDPSSGINLSYTVQGVTEDDLTRAVPGTSDENQITSLYTLFFDHSSDRSGTYLGHTVATVTPSSGASGNAHVTVPGGYDAENNPFSLVFVANIEAYVDRGIHSTVGDYLDATLASQTQDWALKNLTARFASPNGIRTPLLMSTEYDKPAGTKIANILLKRTVARTDVMVDLKPGANASSFDLISAQVWNATNEAYIIDRGGRIPGTGGLSHYKNNVQNAVSNMIKSGLYFFENRVTTPIPGDISSTCLILHGSYNGGAPKYWRVNVCADGSSQEILRNYLYTIKVTDILADGEDTPDEAYTKNRLDVDYTINDWEDDFQGGFVTDEYGNRMALSQRYLTFSDSGSEQIEIEVIRIVSNSDPIMADWSIDAMSGTNPGMFTAVKKNDGSNKFIIARPAGANLSSEDYTATTTVRWGTLSIPIHMKQLNPNSQPHGLKARPDYLWFPKTVNTKRIKVEVMGNFASILPGDFNTSVTYQGSGTGTQDWVRSVNYVSVPSDENQGVYNFDITVESLAAVSPSLPSREASLRFIVNRDGTILTTSARLRQSIIDEGGSGFVRSIDVDLYYEGTYFESNTVAYNDKFVGISDDQKRKENLIFSISSKNTLTYEFAVTSSMEWKIKSVDADFRDYIDIAKMQGGGNGTYETFTIKPKHDYSSSANLEGWVRTFYFEFENGEEVEFTAQQKGAMKLLDQYYDPSRGSNINVATVPDGRIYYYEAIKIGPAVWLDRYIGAETATPTPTGEVSTTATYGKLLISGNTQNYHYNRACPTGFRLPQASKTADVNALKYIWDNAVFIDGTGYDSENNYHPGYTNRWAIKTSEYSDERSYYYPNSARVFFGSGSSLLTPYSTLMWPYMIAKQITVQSKVGFPMGALFLGAEVTTYTNTAYNYILPTSTLDKKTFYWHPPYVWPSNLNVLGGNTIGGGTLHTPENTVMVMATAEDLYVGSNWTDQSTYSAGSNPISKLRTPNAIPIRCIREL